MRNFSTGLLYGVPNACGKLTLLGGMSVGEILSMLWWWRDKPVQSPLTVKSSKHTLENEQIFFEIWTLDQI